MLWRELEPGSDYFVRLLVDKDVESEGGKYNAKFDGKLMSFQDEFIYVREKDRNEKTGVVTYDSPAYLNGIKVRVLIRKDAKNKDGKIVGALRVNGPQGSKVSSKDIMKVKKAINCSSVIGRTCGPNRAMRQNMPGSPHTNG